MAFDARVIKHGPWSVSKNDVLQRCPRQYQFKYVLKEKEQSKKSESKLGVAAHYVLEVALAQPSVDLTELSDKAAAQNDLTTDETRDLRTKLSSIANFVRRIKTFKEDKGVTQELIETKLAITQDYKPCGFFDHRAILRGVVDHALITKDNVMVIIDHKSGRKKPIEQHSTQFYAYMLFAIANYDIAGVQCAINYVGSENVTWFPKANGDHGVWTLHEIIKLRSWLEHTLNACARTLTVIDSLEQGTAAPPNMNNLCGWCGYLDRCPEGQAYVEKRRSAKEEKNSL